MKKALSLLVAFLMLFSSICVGAYAVGEEQQTEETLTDAERIVLTDDELKEKFGIEKILLPDGFEPVAYVYYNGMCDGELPEYLTFVFDDGTSVEIKERNSLYSYNYNDDIRIRAFGFLLKSGSGLQFNVYVSSECSKTFRIDCEIKKMSFADNLKKYIKLMVLYNVSFLSNTDPHGVFIFPVEEIITGDPYIDAILNIFILNYLPHDFLKDVIDETSLFVNYYFKELFSNT